MNTTNIKFKLRGKLRSFVLLTCVATALFLIYKALIDDAYVSLPFKAGNKYGDTIGANALEDVSDLMAITQPQENLDRMHQQEAQMMRNVHNLIRQRNKDASNKSPNDSTNSKYSNTGQTLWSETPKNGLPVPKHIFRKRFVHLDLKGAPPTVDYLQHLFPLLSSLGATGLLLEYEDMFPYWGRLEGIRAFNSYSVVDIREIQRLANDNNLEVIPLIQTFGHMEFVLKNEMYRPMREVPAFPQAICPSNNQSLATIYELIDQVLSLHPNAKHIHIGCDEVYNIGECPLCQDRLAKMQWNTENLFLSHVSSITRYIKARYSVRPIMWDDMFRLISENLILAADIGKYTDILVWKYGNTVGEDLTADIWQKYANCFSGIWIASAFKGASLPSSYATPIGTRLENHVSWMQVVEKFHDRVQFRGVFLTGWQRYDHFAILCELLPAGLPSLAVNLQYLLHLKYDETVQELVRALLGCNRPIGLILNATSPEIQCSFAGSRIYELSLQFFTLNHYLNEQFFDSNYILGWVSDYNINNRFSSPALIEQAMMRYSDGVRNVSIFQNAISEALHMVYDKYTVSEWVETNVRPLLKKLDQYFAVMKTLLVSSSWPRRPITTRSSQDMRQTESAKPFQHAAEP